MYMYISLHSQEYDQHHLSKMRANLFSSKLFQIRTHAASFLGRHVQWAYMQAYPLYMSMFCTNRAYMYMYM